MTLAPGPQVFDLAALQLVAMLSSLVCLINSPSPSYGNAYSLRSPFSRRRFDCPSVTLFFPSQIDLIFFDLNEDGLVPPDTK